LVEEGIRGRELECGVLGNEEPEASVVGEVIVRDEFYSYEAKYVNENGAILDIPALIPAETSETVRRLAVVAFKVLNCAGMARVDFFLTDDGRVLLNEINTVPGFTNISMYPLLWEASGVSYSELIDRLVALALERQMALDELNYDVQQSAPTPGLSE
jgi:D-alanine-D-alanine ligase